MVENGSTPGAPLVPIVPVLSQTSGCATGATRPADYLVVGESAVDDHGDARGCRAEASSIGAFEFDGVFAAPGLQAQARGNQIVLSWPVLGEAILQTTTTISPSSTWQNVSTLATTNGGLRTLTIPVTGQTGFYRLASR